MDYTHARFQVDCNSGSRNLDGGHFVPRTKQPSEAQYQLRINIDVISGNSQSDF